MATILINDTFKKYLLDQPPAARARIRKQFEYLEIGTWDGGLRVKKLKGTPSDKAVFEARLDRSRRILFTLGENETAVGGKKDMLIYIWGVVVHDDVQSRSGNILPGNAPFLKFSPYSESDTDGAMFEDLDHSLFTQESITKKVSDDSGSQKWHEIAAAEWQRVQMYSHNDFEMYLYLTPDQVEVLNSIPPILLSGTAGSGKTTIGVYYLLKPSLGSLRKLFVTYNRYLKNSAENLYNALLNADKGSEEFLPPEFATYRELCLGIAAKAGREYDPDREINYERFADLVRSIGKAAKYDTPLIWEEIRSIIKGALPQLNAGLFETAYRSMSNGQLGAGLVNALQRQLETFSNLESAARIEHIVRRYMQTDIPGLVKALNDLSGVPLDRFRSVVENILELFSKQRELTGKKHLSFLEYETMGKKKAPNFQLDRKDVYRIFEWYQERLETGGMWDEIDLARDATNIIAGTENGADLYDLLICDEVQDLTDVQQELLFYVTRNPLDMVLTGDTKQIINPSGFRWEELKRHFYSRNLKVPDVTFLSLNFRSSGSIVELSNALLDLKTGLLGLSSDQIHEDWKYKSRPPMVVAGVDEDAIVSKLKTTGARKTILVRTESERDRLKRHLETELIFTIYEAKGLEFDTVLLWKFCADELTSDLWKSILGDDERSFHSAKIRHEINLLYVAITRAQRDLLVYDGSSPSVIWSDKSMAEKVFVSDDIDYMAGVWNVISSPDEWLEQGDYFFDREYYKAAIECYRNADALPQLRKARAFFNERSGDFLEAARYFEETGELKRAARDYEKANAYADALRVWTLLKDNAKIAEYTLRVYEQEGRYGELARIYAGRKEYRKAAESFLKEGDYVHAAELFAGKLREYDKAAQYFEAAKEFARAAQLHVRGREFSKAAVLYERAGDLENAIRCWKRAKNEGRLIQIYSSANNYEELLKIYEDNLDETASVKVLKKAYSPVELETQAKALFRSRKFYPAYLRYLTLEDKRGMAECFLRLNEYRKAGTYFEAGGDFYSAGKAFERAKDYSKSFLCFIQSEEDRGRNYERTNRVAARLTGKEISDQGQYFYERNNFEAALHCSIIDRNSVNVGICYYGMGKTDEAVEAWKHSLIFDRIEDVADFCLGQSKPDLVARVILDTSLENLGKGRYGDPFVNENSPVVKAMDRYFGLNPSEEEMAAWAERLLLLDAKRRYTAKVISYFEKSKRYNDYFKLIRELQYGTGRRDAYRSFREYFRSRKEHPSEGSENFAISQYLLSEKKFLKAMQNLEVNAHNYMLFLFTAKKETAYDYLFERSDPETIVSVLRENGEYLRLAHYFESLGDKGEAAHQYWRGRRFEKAAELWIELGSFNKAGDAFTEAGNYPRALEMYEKHGKNQTKIAQTLMKMGEYDRAAEIYKRMGKPNLYQKAKRLSKERGRQNTGGDESAPEQGDLFE